MTIDRITAFITLIIAVGVMFGSAAVVRFYATALKTTPRKHGLLLWHVTAVGIAVTGTWVMLALGQLDILGILETPRWVRLVGYSLFGTLTIVALVLIGMASRRRVMAGPGAVVVTEERRSTTIDNT